MWIAKASLTNFRNYKNLTLDLDNTVTFLVGKNGQGKTNILESIGFISLGKSFRNADARDMVSSGESFLRLKFMVEGSEGFVLETYFGDDKNTTSKRSFWKNGVEQSLNDFLAQLKIVVFSPENINLLLLGPEERRRYLNFLFLQNFPKDFAILGRYAQILAQRNALLYRIKKGYAEKKELIFWNTRLAIEGSQIILKRQELVNRMNETFPRFFSEIAKSDAHAEIVYKSRLQNPENREVVDVFLEELLAHESVDIEKAVTHVGPHRDNFEIRVDENNLLSFGSRGELRTALLAMKFAECEMLPKDQKPILLLDDVFSELDASRRQKVLELARPYQTLVTTCEMEDLPKERENTQLYFVQKGTIEKQ